MMRSGSTSCTITCAICASRSSETEEVIAMKFSCATSFADRTDRGYQSPFRRDGSPSEEDQEVAGAVLPRPAEDGSEGAVGGGLGPVRGGVPRGGGEAAGG